MHIQRAHPPRNRPIIRSAGLLTWVILALLVFHQVPAQALIDVWLDPGHGGTDPGNLGVGGPANYEKHMCLAVANATDLSLAGLGFVSEMTRNSDNFITLDQRAQIANGDISNDLGIRDSCQLLVSIHMNAGPSSARGTETYYPTSKTYGKSKKTYLADQAAANAIHPPMMSYMNLAFLFCSTDRGVKTANHLVTRKSKSPAVLIEVCFLTNSCQQPKIASATNQNIVGDGIATGITYAISPSGPVPPGTPLAVRRPILGSASAAQGSGVQRVGRWSPVPEPASPSAASRLQATFQEGFEGATFPPAGWTTQSAGVPPPHNWGRSLDPDYVSAGGASALVQGGYGSPMDEWLITPAISLGAGDRGLQFSWSGSSYWATAANPTSSVRIVGSGTWTTLWSLVSDEPASDPFVYRNRVVSLTPFAGQSVQFAFRVQGTSGADFGLDDVMVGDFSPTAPPANDLCAGAVDLPRGNFQLSGLTCYATSQTNPYSGSGGSCVGGELSGPDVVYRVHAGAGDTLSVQLAAQWNGAIYLLDSCGTASPTCLAAGYPVDGSTQPALAQTFSTSGVYYLVVDGGQGSCGPFTMAGRLAGGVVGLGDGPGPAREGVIQLIAGPNPSRGPVHFEVRSAARAGGVARLQILDASGRRVHQETLRLDAGMGRATWDARDSQGRWIRAGIYYASVEAAGLRATKKVALLR